MRGSGGGRDGEQPPYEPKPVRDGPPYEGGSQPVGEHPTPPPSEGQGAAQTVILVVGVLVVLAALLWILVPLVR